jgi:hypothetical protein
MKPGLLLLIGGVVDRDDKVLVLYRGNLERLVVSFKWFRVGRASPRPDFEGFEVTDSGQTVRLGEYEAAADAILYELDPEARRRIESAQVEKDETHHLAALGVPLLARVHSSGCRSPLGTTARISVG